MSVRPTLIAYTIKTKNRPEFDKFRVTFSNPTFFQLFPTGKYEYFYVECANADEIRETLRLRLPDVKEYKIGSDEEIKRTPVSLESQVKTNLAEKKVEEESAEYSVEAVETEEEPIPEDYAELSWKDLRKLASKYIDGKFTKEEALEKLAEIKGA